MMKGGGVLWSWVRGKLGMLPGMERPLHTELIADHFLKKS
jgi:hypothetical protein